jgi:Rrf2 family protein
MRVTTQGEYGLRCMINIGKNGVRGPVSIHTISSDEDLPRTYVEQLLLKLRRNRLIKSIRGARGGYLLAKPMNEITMQEIIEALEGSVFEVVCDRRMRKNKACKYNANCSLHYIWVELKSKVVDFLAGVSLEQLVDGDIKLLKGG